MFMVQCPNCNKTVKMLPRVYINAETYNLNRPLLGHSECCGIGFNVKAVVHYEITPYEGEKTEDDWGVPITTYKK